MLEGEHQMRQQNTCSKGETIVCRSYALNYMLDMESREQASKAASDLEQKAEVKQLMGHAVGMGSTVTSVDTSPGRTVVRP